MFINSTVIGFGQGFQPVCGFSYGAGCARFLSETDGFAPLEFDAGGIPSKDGMLTLWPHVHGTDGFFIAKFQKKVR